MIPSYNSSHSITNSTPNVLKADNNPAYAYAFPSNNQQTTNTGGWLSGLRSKISLFTGISDWMNQLGIGDNKQSNNNVNLGYSTSSNTSTDSSPMEDTLIYPSVSLLDDQPSSSDPLTNPWDFGASFLADLDSSHNWDDTLEKQHFGPLNDLITLGGKGHGHSFQCVSLIHPTWCDKCGDFIWGILRQAIKCQNCNLTCHERCRNLITLDCRSADSTISSSQIFSLYPQLNDGTLGTIPKDIQLPSMPNSPEKKQINGISVVNPLFSPSKISSTLPRSFAPLYDDSTLKTHHTVKTSEGQTIQIEEIYVKEDTPFEWTPQYIQNDLEEKIKIFNQSADSIMNMTLNADGITFHGNIQVRMNFTRPISIVSGEQIPTHYDIMSNETSKTMNKMTITSFFLPRNTVKTININSEMTSRQMIVTLLRKFRVADNARKFALYECNQEEDEGTSTLLRRMKRIGDEICPLRVVLNWDFNTTNTLVLQENDTGDIIWDAFEVPELNNFIRILGLEEQQYQYQIRQKYNQYRYQLHEELRRRGHDIESDDPLPEPPSPHKQKTMNEYGTSDSMIVSDVFTTMKESSNPSEYSNDPMYVNIDFLKNNKMDESTKL